MEKLDDIAGFVTVARSGSFTAAAEQLGCSKTAISRQVSRLETALGVQLLHRTTRRLHLTEAGQQLFSEAEAGLGRLDEALAQVRSQQSEPTGVLRLNAPMSFGILHLAPHIGAFLQRYPKLDVDMQLDDRQLDLIQDGFDLAIRIAQLRDSSLVARRLAAAKHVVCASPNYLQQHGCPRDPLELRRHPLISYRYQEQALQWDFTSSGGETVSIPVDGRLQMSNSLAIREALLAGSGLALIPTFIVGPDLKASRLQAVLGHYRVREVGIHAIYPDRRHLPPKVRVFIDFLAERLGDPPHWDQGWSALA